jgi:hypothetical protein
MHQSAHPPPATPADQNPMHLFPARPSPPSRAEPESTFSRIIPMNPEPSTALAPTQAPPPHQHPMHQTAHPPPATPAHQHPMHQFSARSSPPSRAEPESTFSRTNSHESGTRHGARANPHATVAPTPHAPDRTPAPNDAGASTPHAPIRGPAEPAIPRRPGKVRPLARRGQPTHDSPRRDTPCCMNCESIMPFQAGCRTC